MRYYQATFHIEPDTEDARDIVAMLCGEVGFESFQESDDGLKGYVQVETFDKDSLNHALEDFPIPGVKVTYNMEEVPEEDWNATWENNGFEPIVIGDRCVIYDAKHQKDAEAPTDNQQAPELRIGIEARQAFGTGTHETTQMIVETLLDMDLNGKRVLDCGCGTGILGIVAAKRGAKEVIGYDIDEWSVRNAKHNAQLNNVEIEVFEGDRGVLSHVCGMFNVVLANINRNILLADMSSFADVMDADAKLIMSGFYEEDIPTLTEKASSLGLKMTASKSRNDWACITLEHS